VEKHVPFIVLLAIVVYTHVIYLTDPMSISSSLFDSDCAFIHDQQDEGRVLQQAERDIDAVAGLPEDAAAGRSMSEQAYVDSGNQKKILYLLCIGMTTANDNGNAPLFSFDEEPWLSLPKTDFRPRNNDFIREVLRRASALKVDPMPRPSNWTRVQNIEWLERYPIACEEDVTFLNSEVLRVREKSLRKNQEILEQQQNAVIGGGNIGRGGNWRGCVPYLRVILCLTQDAVKRLFLTRAHALTRAELDARNSDSRYVMPMSICAMLFNVNDALTRYFIFFHCL
jgi:hypothetical protein